MFKSKKELREQIRFLSEDNDKYRSRIVEIERENNQLKEKLSHMEVLSKIANPCDPLVVVDTLINSKYEHTPLMIWECGTYDCYGIDELEQIAKHLLAYCECTKKK